jgi:hypothetical protein
MKSMGKGSKEARKPPGWKKPGMRRTEAEVTSGNASVIITRCKFCQTIKKGDKVVHKPWCNTRIPGIVIDDPLVEVRFVRR